MPSKSVLLGVLLWASVSTAQPSGGSSEYRRCDSSMAYGVLRKAGDTFYADGLRPQAAECYAIATRINAKDEVAFFRMGNVARERNDLRGAMDHYMKAVVARNNFSEAHNNLGITYSEVGRKESALASFDRALQHAPGLADAHYNRANVLKDTGQVGAAIQGYLRAVDLAPDNVQYYNNLALAWMAAGDNNAAVAACDQCLKIDPKYSTAHYNLANALLDAGNVEQAVAAYQQAIRTNPGESEYHHNLAFGYERLRQQEKAVSHLRRALAIKPGFLEGRCNLVDLLAGTTQWREWKKQRTELATRLRDSLQEDDAIAPIAAPRSFRCNAHLAPSLQLAMAAAHAAGVEDIADNSPQLSGGSGADVETAAFVQPRRMRVAYFAAGYGSSAVSGHIVDAMTQHTLGSYEVYGFQLLQEPRSANVDLIDGTTDARVVDLSRLSEEAAARKVYTVKPHISILIDGYTSADRTAVLAMHPAPVSAQYLSQGSSSGGSFLSYALTDRMLSPPDQLELWKEKLTILPVAHVNQYWKLRREINLQPMRASEGRDDYGLPLKRFVLSNLGSFSRLDPSTFASWCNMLSRLPNATLWLTRPNDHAEVLMERQLESCGAARDHRKRVHFSNVVARDEQIRRGSIADIALDTPMHSAHTSTVETVWGGTPVGTVLKQGALHRVAASALAAADPQDSWSALSRTTHKELEDQVIQLATGPKFSNQRNREYDHLKLFDMKQWSTGGLNLLMQRYKKHGLTVEP